MLDSAIPQTPPGGAFDGVEVVVADSEVFAPFVEDALEQYRMGRESVGRTGSRVHRPNSFGLLGGTCEGDALVVRQLAFAANVRAVGSVPQEEFKENIVPKFGKQYDDGERGFWCDSRELLDVTRRFEALGLDMLGSIHMHPDWHRIGPAHERGTETLSERPSRMDEYLFTNAGWPLNIICYLESRGDGITHTYAAWCPPASDAPSPKVRGMAIRFFARGHSGAG
ncbi:MULTISPECIES: hypothetical protein [Streptomyces]|uniref:JAB domain-containing protein n=1 Tax=Streptomyces lycii TaxID=2654337 RepID=A0ABQ7FK18_9ACTN|nr:MULTISPECIES: hypothetical protein [Streptomyces]KAF4409321.1 hypothetical protein GCU69_09570 [Streptomyces lycii]PGH47028.1 hypothetical protein CRI70_30800 [Streptomyces sp. Ru87]